VGAAASAQLPGDKSRRYKPFDDEQVGLSASLALKPQVDINCQYIPQLCRHRQDSHSSSSAEARGAHSAYQLQQRWDSSQGEGGVPEPEQFRNGLGSCSGKRVPGVEDSSGAERIILGGEFRLIDLYGSWDWLIYLVGERVVCSILQFFHKFTQG
jgi:hypothetical protein